MWLTCAALLLLALCAVVSGNDGGAQEPTTLLERRGVWDDVKTIAQQIGGNIQNDDLSNNNQNDNGNSNDSNNSNDGNGSNNDDNDGQQQNNHGNSYNTSPSSNNNNNDNSNDNLIRGGGQLLYSINFARDFQNRFNPRNPNAEWKIAEGGLGASFPVNNAWFRIYANNNQEVINCTEEYGSQSCSSNNNYNRRSSSGSYVQLSSEPTLEEGYDEANIVPRFNFSVSTSQRILGRAKVSCHLERIEPHPWPPELVVDPQGDPRLANCVFELNVLDNTIPAFYFLLDNKYIWAGYSGANFLSKRKVGRRARYDEVADLGLELDRRRAVINFYVAGRLVWTVGNFGAPPPMDGITRVEIGTRNDTLNQIIDIPVVRFTFATAKCIDETDPNNPTSTIKLQRILPPDSPLYGPDTVFFDANKTLSKLNYGQGITYNLYKFQITRGASAADRPYGRYPSQSQKTSNADEYL